MAEAPNGLDIHIVKPENYDTILQKSQKTAEPYTLADLAWMKARAAAANSVVFVAFITPELWDD